MISFEVIDEPDKIKEYFPMWDELFNSREYEASLSIDWTNALRKTHLQGASYFLVVLRDSSGILGILPLCIKEARKFGLSVLTLIPISEYFNTHSDILLTSSSEEVIEALLKVLSGLKYKWDIFRINRFIETNPVLDRIIESLKNRASFIFDLRRTEPSYFIELGDSYDDYLRTKSANFRYKLKNTAKKMHALGEVDFLGAQDFRDFSEAYNAILTIEANSWKHKHGTAITSSEKQKEFYRSLCQSAFDKGWLRLCILYLNHQPVAFEMGLVKGKKYYGVHASYDEKYKKENPGTMLLARYIEDLIRDGIKEYDWFGEPFEFQSRWTDKYRWHKSLLIYNRTLKARMFFVFNKLKSRLKRRDVSDQIVFLDPRSVRPE
jgi:CelD/BcsL family acetyltransferase involved in cellulose biosynthesis